MSFDQRKVTDNWAETSWDRDVWFPIPISFQGTKWADAAEWAFDYAGDRFLRGGRELNKKVVKKEVLPFAQSLVLARSQGAGKLAGHKLYFHCPDYTKIPVVAAIGLWKREGTREEAFQYYSYWGTETATVPPVAEWFETESLGRGVKAHWSGVAGTGPYDQVNYIFRDDDFDTDVHVFLMSWSHERFLEVLPDLDTLVRTIRCTPDPDKSKT
ncbi:hypothetical protein G3I60_28180 [Streptomyces sp. SID13666]|uniref:hypothetical protein n=1 Tax=unclassified Streptomyces TaxID=2593676 RepID=UPI0013C00F36|nr:MULTISPECIES: hypothetical protein [unclassified Streptomyces]NEA57933.1 hypothetical protein [Streptomyces sp. SID13666]NEA76331.1 hypothetical protein [Streptomyces sp. SID13588]